MRPVTMQDCILLKDSSLVLAAGWCLISVLESVNECRTDTATWSHAGDRPHVIIFFIFCLESPRAGSGPTNWWTVPFPCELIGNFIFKFPRMSGTQESQKMMGGSIIQCVLAPLYQWGCCFSSLKSFLRCVTFRANTDIFWLALIL
jgi:hypothetical protein